MVAPKIAHLLVWYLFLWFEHYRVALVLPDIAFISRCQFISERNHLPTLRGINLLLIALGATARTVMNILDPRQISLTMHNYGHIMMGTRRETIDLVDLIITGRK